MLSYPIPQYTLGIMFQQFRFLAFALVAVQVLSLLFQLPFPVAQPRGFFFVDIGSPAHSATWECGMNPFPLTARRWVNDLGLCLQRSHDF